MAMINKYQKRISGPVMDRIDIHLDVPRVPMQKLASLEGGEPSFSIRQRVENARAIQHARFAPVNKPNVLVNGDMGPSARAYHRILKLRRTIADLAGSGQVLQPHLAGALQYRPRQLP